MKKLLLLAAILILTSCKTTKETTSTETKTDTIFITTVKHDTIIRYKKETITPPSKIETTFNPCDSIGNVKPTDVIIKTKYVTLKVKDTLGELKFQVLSDSVKQVYESTYESKLNQELEKRISEYKKTVKEKTVISVWSKWTYIFLIINIILIVVLFSRIKSFIPTLF